MGVGLPQLWHDQGPGIGETEPVAFIPPGYGSPRTLGTPDDIGTRRLILGREPSKDPVPCPICGTEFIPTRTDQIYDRPRCQKVAKQRRYNERRRARA